MHAGIRSFPRLSLTKLRRFSTFVSGLIFSLTILLCLQSYVLHIWILSFDRHPWATSIRTSSHDFDIISSMGRFSIEVYPEPDRWAEQRRWSEHYPEQGPNSIVRFHLSQPWSFLAGYPFVDVYTYGGRWYWTIGVGYFPIALASGILPGIWASRKLRARRIKQRRDEGLCVTCGYDMRASPERCPECGTPAH